MLQPLTRRLNNTISPSAAQSNICNCKYSMLVFSILEQHIGDLTSCRFLHLLDLNLEAWIKKVLVEKRRELKDLSIVCEPINRMVKQPFPDTDVWDSFCSLDSFELGCYFLETPPTTTFEPCKNLKTLKLRDMYVKGETTDEILRCCVCLENLTLSNSFGFENIEIRNPNLKFLELNGLCMDHIV